MQPHTQTSIRFPRLVCVDIIVCLMREWINKLIVSDRMHFEATPKHINPKAFHWKSSQRLESPGATDTILFDMFETENTQN